MKDVNIVCCRIGDTNFTLQKLRNYNIYLPTFLK